MPRSKSITPFAEAGTALWDSIAGPGRYTLRPDESAVLAKACETADMIAFLDKEWAALGKPFMTRGSMGQDVIHPLIGERRAQSSALAALLRQLKLPDEAAVGAVPNQQRSAAQSRWQHGA